MAQSRLEAPASAPGALWLAHPTVRRYGKQLEDLAGRYAAQLNDAGNGQAVLLAQALGHLEYEAEIGERAVESAARWMLPQFVAAAKAP